MRSFIVEQLASRIVNEVLNEAAQDAAPGIPYRPSHIPADLDPNRIPGYTKPGLPVYTNPFYVVPQLPTSPYPSPKPEQGSEDRPGGMWPPVSIDPKPKPNYQDNPYDSN